MFNALVSLGLKMSKHKSVLWWVIFLAVVAGVLVYCFFEKKDKEIEQSIQQLETTADHSAMTSGEGIQNRILKPGQV